MTDNNPWSGNPSSDNNPRSLVWSRRNPSSDNNSPRSPVWSRNPSPDNNPRSLVWSPRNPSSENNNPRSLVWSGNPSSDNNPRKRRYLPNYKDEFLFPRRKENPLQKELWDLVKEYSEEKEEHNDMESIASDPRMPIFKAYLKEMHESDGFDVGDYRAKLPGFYELTVPLNRYSEVELAEQFNGHAKSAIELYNSTSLAKFKFVKIVKANWKPPFTHLITFTASDERDGPKVFQASVVRDIGRDPTVSFCRLKKGNR